MRDWEKLHTPETDAAFSAFQLKLYQHRTEPDWWMATMRLFGGWHFVQRHCTVAAMVDFLWAAYNEVLQAEATARATRGDPVLPPAHDYVQPG